MKIISHRGYWKLQIEKNTTESFKRSFDLGFGTETDIRDCCGELVISHDMPIGRELKLDDFLGMVANYPTEPPLPLALNIKADGMAKKLKEKLKLYPALNYYFFDMSIPDMRSYIELGLPTYSRVSEYEHPPIFYEQAAGVWLDGFDSDWFGNELIIDLLKSNKPVCVVSPELHGRPHEALWRRMHSIKDQSNLMLCTDLPEAASSFFRDEKV